MLRIGKEIVSVTRRDCLRDHVKIIHRFGFLPFVTRLTTSKEPSYRILYALFMNKLILPMLKGKGGKRNLVQSSCTYVYIAAITKWQASLYLLVIRAFYIDSYSSLHESNREYLTFNPKWLLGNHQVQHSENFFIFCWPASRSNSG